MRPIAETMLEMVREIITAVQERGEIRNDIDLDMTVRLINVLMIAVGDSQLLPYLNVYYQLHDGDVLDDRLLAGLLDLVLSGIRVANDE
ncbi:MAG: hypothetical protein GY943_28795 [Chloroflexi bacterium]|nr:hypothetical protein [Chloroflexota bacterium]